MEDERGAPPALRRRVVGRRELDRRAAGDDAVRPEPRAAVEESRVAAEDEPAQGERPRRAGEEPDAEREEPPAAPGYQSPRRSPRR